MKEATASILLIEELFGEGKLAGMHHTLSHAVQHVTGTQGKAACT